MMFRAIATRRFCTNPQPITPFIQLLEPGTTGIIVLNRPAEINAINHEMSEEIFRSLKKFESAKTHVIVKGAGGRSFCIGRDMTDIMVNPIEVTTERFRNEFQAFYLISNYKKPYIAIIDGVSFGGACGFAMNGKIRVATERSVVSDFNCKDESRLSIQQK